MDMARARGVPWNSIFTPKLSRIKLTAKLMAKLCNFENKTLKLCQKRPAPLARPGPRPRPRPLPLSFAVLARACPEASGARIWGVKAQKYHARTNCLGRARVFSASVVCLARAGLRVLYSCDLSRAAQHQQAGQHQLRRTAASNNPATS